jgi:hypothetical protein
LFGEANESLFAIFLAVLCCAMFFFPLESNDGKCSTQRCVDERPRDDNAAARRGSLFHSYTTKFASWFVTHLALARQFEGKRKQVLVFVLCAAACVGTTNSERPPASPSARL